MWRLLVIGCLVACALAGAIPEQEDPVYYKLTPEESGAVQYGPSRRLQLQVVPIANPVEKNSYAEQETEAKPDGWRYQAVGPPVRQDERSVEYSEAEGVVVGPQDERISPEGRQSELAETQAQLRRKLEISGGKQAVDSLDQPLNDGYGYGGGGYSGGGYSGGQHHGKGHRKHGSQSYGEGGGKDSYHDSGKGDHGYSGNEHGEHHGKGRHRGHSGYEGGVKWHGGHKDRGSGKYGNHGSYSGHHTGQHHNKYHAGFGDKYKHQGERIKTYSYGGHGWYKEKTHGHVSGHGGQKGGEEGKHGGKYHGHDSSNYHPSYSNHGEDSGYRKHKGWN